MNGPKLSEISFTNERFYLKLKNGFWNFLKSFSCIIGVGSYNIIKLRKCFSICENAVMYTLNGFVVDNIYTPCKSSSNNCSRYRHKFIILELPICLLFFFFRRHFHIHIYIVFNRIVKEKKKTKRWSSKFSISVNCSQIVRQLCNCGNSLASGSR